MTFFKPLHIGVTIYEISKVYMHGIFSNILQPFFWKKRRFVWIQIDLQKNLRQLIH